MRTSGDRWVPVTAQVYVAREEAEERCSFLIEKYDADDFRVYGSASRGYGVEMMTHTFVPRQKKG